MKLRAPLSRQQILFVAGCALLLAWQPMASAQQATFRMKGSPAVQQGNVIGADASGVKIQVGAQTVTLPPSAFDSFEMAPPAEYRQGYEALTARDYPTALARIKSVTDKYKGLPTAWAQYATGLLGDIYLEMDDTVRAETAFSDAKRLYPTPGGPSVIAEVGPARILVKKKEYAAAKAKLDPVITEALQEKNPPPAKAMAYSKAFLASGQVKQAEGNLQGALEDYLRTITIFYHDPAAVSLAQEQADALRAANKDQSITVP